MDDDWGGPLAQADFAGSGVEIFGAVAVEDLLILQPELDHWQRLAPDTMEAVDGAGREMGQLTGEAIEWTSKALEERKT